VLVFVTLLSLYACGGGTSSSSGGTSSGGTGDYVAAATAREARCNDGGVVSENKKADFQQQQTCFNAAFADPGKVAQCLTSRACGASDDPCYVDAARAANPKVASYAQTCNARREECKMGGGMTFSDDLCSLSVLNDVALDQISACMKQGCGAVKDCVDSVLRNYACDF
jgi:hypothetical protein